MQRHIYKMNKLDLRESKVREIKKEWRNIKRKERMRDSKKERKKEI